MRQPVTSFRAKSGRASWLVLVALLAGFAVWCVPHDALAAGRAGASKSGSTTEAPDPRLVDQSLLKANDLENLIRQKISQIVTTTLSRSDLFRASANITMERKVLAPERPAAEPAIDKRPQAPIAEGNLFDVQSLVDHYEDELSQIKSSNRPIQISLNHEDRGVDQNAFYEVTGLNAFVTIDDQVAKEIVDKVQRDLRDALSPVFGLRLNLQVNLAKLAPSLWDRIVEGAYRFQAVVIALLACGLVLLALMFQKLVPSWQAQHAKRSEHAQNRSNVNQDIPDPNGKNDEKPETASELKAGHESDAAADATTKELRDEIASLELQISNFAKSNPSIPHALLQEWSGAEGGLRKFAILLGTLARHGVNVERVEVRAEVLRRIREASGVVSELSVEELRNSLREIHWNCISMSFLGEDVAVSPFLFLESVGDDALGELLARENVESQATVLMALHEKRASKVLSKLAPEQREGVLGRICSGGVLTPDAAQDVIDRLQTGVTEYLETHDRRLSAANSGVTALIPVLKNMDFSTEFATASSLLKLERELRNGLEASYFCVALLPDARPEFLSSIFVDREPAWIEMVTAGFGAEFKERVISLLPPFQQRMLQEGGAEQATQSQVMNTLKELNDQVLASVAKGELQPSDIFAGSSQEEPDLRGGDDVQMAA